MGWLPSRCACSAERAFQRAPETQGAAQPRAVAPGEKVDFVPALPPRRSHPRLTRPRRATRSHGPCLRDARRGEQARVSSAKPWRHGEAKPRPCRAMAGSCGGAPNGFLVADWNAGERVHDALGDVVCSGADAWRCALLGLLAQCVEKARPGLGVHHPRPEACPRPCSKQGKRRQTCLFPLPGMVGNAASPELAPA